MRGVRIEVLEKLEDAVAVQIRLYERGCPTTGDTEAAESVKVGNLNIRAITMQGFSKVRSNNYLEGSSHYFWMTLIFDNSDQTARMCRLIWALAVRICSKTRVRMAWCIYKETISTLFLNLYRE